MTIDSGETGEAFAGIPQFAAIFHEEVLDLQPRNTTVHIFDNPIYDHVRHFPDDGIEAKFFQVDGDTMNMMRMWGFLAVHHEAIDPTTEIWFSRAIGSDN